MNRRYLKMAIIIIVAVFAGIGGIAIPTLLHPGEGAEASVAQNHETQVKQVKQISEGNANQTTEDQALNKTNASTESKYSSENLTNILDSGEIDSEEIEIEISAATTADTINQDWIEARIEEYRDQIADEDLDDFRYIIGKLDMNYVNEIIEGRHGSDIDPILKEYLHSKLTSPEYSRARDLFYAYNHLLF